MAHDSEPPIIFNDMSSNHCHKVTKAALTENDISSRVLTVKLHSPTPQIPETVRSNFRDWLALVCRLVHLYGSIGLFGVNLEPVNLIL